jgi:hypothetical protein
MSWAHTHTHLMADHHLCFTYLMGVGSLSSASLIWRALCSRASAAPTSLAPSPHLQQAAGRYSQAKHWHPPQYKPFHQLCNPGTSP